MENKTKEKITIIVGVIVSLCLIAVSWFSPDKLNLSIKVIYTLISVIFITLMIKLVDSFNAKDRYKLDEIIKWISNKNSNISEEINIKNKIAKEIKCAERVWLLANTATGFFANYEDSFNAIKNKSNRIITLKQNCVQYKEYLKNITDPTNKKKVKIKFEDLINELPHFGEYRQCNSLPNFSLLIINPKGSITINDNEAIIYLFIKLNSVLLGKDPVITIRNTDERLYKEFIEFYNKTWNLC